MSFQAREVVIEGRSSVIRDQVTWEGQEAGDRVRSRTR